MRRLAAAAWLLATACSVPLEGAPCTSDANCPGGQRCGVDGKCSEAAAACPGTPGMANYPPAPSLNCQPNEQYCGDDATIVTCVADSNVCSHFPTSGGSVCASGVCGLGPAGPACRPKYYAGLSFTAPATGAIVGLTGVDVSVTLTLSAPGVPVPATVELQGQGMAVPLASSSPVGLTVVYEGKYVPAPADATVQLTIVAAKGTIDEISTTRSVWVDTVAPLINSVTMTCSDAPCVRDSTLTVTASVTDSHPGSVNASVSLVPSFTLALAGGSGSYSGDFAVKDHPFPHFSAIASAQVTATDQAGNTATRATSSDVPVTRLRWVTQVEAIAPPSLTGVAVDANGNLYAGGSNGKLYVLDPGGSVTRKWPVGGSFTTAPAVGGSGIWIGDQTTVYLVNPSTGTIVNGSGCLIGGAATTPAIAPLTSETAFVGSQVGRLFAVAAPAKCTNSGAYEPFYAAPVIDASGNVYAASGQGRLRSVRLDLTGFFQENWPSPGYASVGASVRQPPAVAGTTVWSASFEAAGKIYQTSGSGSSTLFATATSLTDPVVLSNGDVVVGDGSALRKWNAAGIFQWTSPDLGAPVVSAMALASGGAAFLVPTAGGTAYALDANGSIVWQGTLGGAALTEGNIFKLNGDAFSTAVFAAADGKVHAVLVDEILDTSAQWPKVHHDTRNTGNTATPLP